jgi:hypothetical protein
MKNFITFCDCINNYIAQEHVIKVCLLISWLSIVVTISSFTLGMWAYMVHGWNAGLAFVLSISSCHFGFLCGCVVVIFSQRKLFRIGGLGSTLICINQMFLIWYR